MAAQEVAEDDRLFLETRLGAFICEYLIDVCSGQRLIEDGRILMHVPIQDDIMNKFDPYAVAVELATNRSSLRQFLEAVSSPRNVP